MSLEKDIEKLTKQRKAHKKLLAKVLIKMDIDVIRN